jgi:hypothetical protein
MRDLIYKGQLYTYVGERPYTTRDGRESPLVELQSCCVKVG